MKVLTVVNDLGIGGTQRSAKNYAALYHEMGYQSALLSLSGKDEHCAVKWFDQYRLKIFYKSRGLPEHKAAAITAKLITWRPDIVHIHNNGIFYSDLADWLPDISPKPLVLETCHFPVVADYFFLVDAHLQLSYWCLWQFYNALFHREKISNKRKATFQNAYRNTFTNSKEKKTKQVLTTILPHVIDIDAFSMQIKKSEKKKLRQEMGLPPNGFIFAAIGQPIRDRWSPLVFTSFAKVCQKHENAFLLLIGLPDQLRHYYLCFPQAIRKNIFIWPFLRDPAALTRFYLVIDAYLHISDQGETFGMAIAEAMLAKLPVISLFTPYAANSQYEVLNYGKGGMTAASHVQLIQFMIELLKDKDKCRQIGNNACQSISKRYNKVILSHKLKKLIEQLFDLKKGKTESLRYKIDIDYTYTKREVKKQIQAVYGWKYIFHLPNVIYSKQDKAAASWQACLFLPLINWARNFSRFLIFSL